MKRLFLFFVLSCLVAPLWAGSPKKVVESAVKARSGKPLVKKGGRPAIRSNEQLLSAYKAFIQQNGRAPKTYARPVVLKKRFSLTEEQRNEQQLCTSALNAFARARDNHLNIADDPVLSELYRLSQQYKNKYTAPSYEELQERLETFIKQHGRLPRGGVVSANCSSQEIDEIKLLNAINGAFARARDNHLDISTIPALAQIHALREQYISIKRNNLSDEELLEVVEKWVQENGGIRPSPSSTATKEEIRLAYQLYKRSLRMMKNSSLRKRFNTIANLPTRTQRLKQERAAQQANSGKPGVSQ